MIARLHLLIRAYRKRWKADRRGETELRLLPLLVRGGTAVDIGANKGVYAYFLSRLCDRVIAYEPNPGLAETIRSYNLPKVEIRACAASDEAGEAVLNIPLSARGRRRNNVASLDPVEGAVDPIRVPTVRLDDESLQTVTFLKIDVEGHELAVLQGAEALIARDRPVILVEINGGPETSHARKVFDLLDAWAYVPLQHHRGVLKHASTLDPADMARRDRNYICLPQART